MPTNLILQERPRPPANAKAATKLSVACGKAIREEKSRVAIPIPIRAVRQADLNKSASQLKLDFAHELNNLLTVILGHTEFLLKRAESQKISRLRVEEIRNAAERGVWLTDRLLISVSRK